MAPKRQRYTTPAKTGKNKKVRIRPKLSFPSTAYRQPSEHCPFARSDPGSTLSAALEKKAQDRRNTCSYSSTANQTQSTTIRFFPFNL